MNRSEKIQFVKNIQNGMSINKAISNLYGRMVIACKNGYSLTVGGEVQSFKEADFVILNKKHGPFIVLEKRDTEPQ